MNKIKLLLVSIGILFLLWIASWFEFFSLFGASKTSVPSPTASVETNQKVSLSVVFGDKDNVEFSTNLEGQDLTAFDLLKQGVENKGLKMDTQKYDFGIFVKSINNLESNAKKSWIYFVNGESGTVAADQYKLKPGDKVEWKYLAPSGE